VRHVEWELDVVSLTFALANHLKFTLGSREKFTHVEAMDGDIEHRVIIIKYIACAITNVYVPVEDAHFALVELFLGDSGCHRHVIEKAKTVNGGAVGMMARRPHDRKDRVYWIQDLLPAKCSDGFDCATSCEKRSDSCMHILIGVLRKPICILPLVQW
jgi:hypothetical protein